jgi:hypothetical protein
LDPHRNWSDNTSGNSCGSLDINFRTDGGGRRRRVDPEKEAPVSLVAIIVQAAAVHVLTDGAGLMPDGKHGGTVVKAMPLPHLNMVVSARGPVMTGLFAGLSLCGAGQSFDQVKERAPDVARKINATPGFSAPFEIFAAGFSEADGPTAWMIGSHSEIADVWPFELVELGNLTVFPLFGPSRIGLLDDLEGPQALDFVDELLEDVRHTPVPLTSKFGGPLGCSIGHFAQLTTVTRDEISTRIVKRWPDQVGEYLTAG